MEQMCGSMDKNRIQGVSAGRAGSLPRSPHPSKAKCVDPATVHRRLLSLPQEICAVSGNGLRPLKGDLTAGQKSAEGILDHDVGRASEALRSRKAEQWIGRAGNEGRRPERVGEAGRP
jgi:hypothetical protein